mmetsp:Transcript_79195/g.154886  ORF Transcript_79195/g.154886 Transcript_79195/m.154886 type:complete len:204 (-) Transcript_79195:216-827(-)
MRRRLAGCLCGRTVSAATTAVTSSLFLVMATAASTRARARDEAAAPTADAAVAGVAAVDLEVEVEVDAWSFDGDARSVVAGEGTSNDSFSFSSLVVATLLLPAFALSPPETRHEMSELESSIDAHSRGEITSQIPSDAIASTTVNSSPSTSSKLSPPSSPFSDWDSPPLASSYTVTSGSAVTPNSLRSRSPMARLRDTSRLMR